MGQSTSKAGISAEKLWSLNEMERTGGEPDVVGHDKKTGEYIFFDCSAESPKGRRSVCYDREALESRREHKQKITLLIWPLPWALSFNGRNNIESCRNLEISIRKRRTG